MFEANLRTTARGIRPPIDVDAALTLALRVAIASWPRLPRFNVYKNTYSLASEGVPGIALDPEGEGAIFNTACFCGDFGVRRGQP